MQRYGVVVVTVQYTLGTLGFLALESFRNKDGGLGNFGFKDQRFGFQCVQENIANFGGDPDKIIIFGESAGGISIMG